MSQDAYGLPEKLGPCGDEGGGAPTGIVTAFRPGETIAVTIDEVIPHPGHYRVALTVADRSALPPEPRVTPRNGDPCGSAAVEDPPTFPVLADNILPHTEPFAGPQTFTITLPTDVTCTRCTLQVLEFMSSHLAPCFYHHCADISIDGTPLAPTSTTLPAGGVGAGCRTPRCSVDAVLDGPACSSDEVPAALRRKLDRAVKLLARATSGRPRRTRILRKTAKRLAERARGSAVRVSRGTNPRLSAGCATSIEQIADALVGGL